MFHLFLSKSFILGQVHSRPFLAPVRIAACYHEITPELKNSSFIREIKVRGLMNVLKLFLKKVGGETWPGLVCLRIETGGRLL